MEAKETFWMVWGGFKTSPVYQHPTERAARDEAARLAVQHGGRFWVLEAIASCEKNDVTWTSTEKPIPF